MLFRGIIENGYPATLDPETRKQAMDQHIKLHDARIGVFRRARRVHATVKDAAGRVLGGVADCVHQRGQSACWRAPRSRTKEVGVRLSIGASRGRLVRQFLTESLVLSSWAAPLGVLLAWGASRALVLLTDRTQTGFRALTDARLACIRPSPRRNVRDGSYLWTRSGAAQHTR